MMMKKIYPFALGTLVGGLFCFFIVVGTKSVESPDEKQGSSRYHSIDFDKDGGSDPVPRSKMGGRQEKPESNDLALFANEYLEEKPYFLAKLNVWFFNSSLDPMTEDWDLFGVGAPQVEMVRSEVLGACSEAREKESSNFRLIENEDDKIKLALPPLEKGDSDAYRGRIVAAFSSVFPPKLAEAAADNFINNNLVTTAGLDGRSRIVTILPADDSGVPGRKFRIRTDVLYPGCSVDNAERNGSGIMLKGMEELVKEIPPHWAHLFSEE